MTVASSLNTLVTQTQLASGVTGQQKPIQNQLFRSMCGPEDRLIDSCPIAPPLVLRFVFAGSTQAPPVSLTDGARNMVDHILIFCSEPDAQPSRDGPYSVSC